MKLLIIDDEPHIRQMMRLTLEATGYEVDEAADGQAGLDRLQAGQYDAILLDQKMPGIDGLETLRRIKQRNADVSVVMITAYASIELAVDAMRLGATDFLRKPMTPETLRGAVGAAIANAASRRSTGREPAPPPSTPPEVTVMTMNGFQILRPTDAERSSSPEHMFRVRHVSDGVEFPVTVVIDPEAVERVTRLTRRHFEPSGAFWRSQAERLLSAYVWTEGQGPPYGRLVVRDVPLEDLDIAPRWEGD